MTDIVKSRQELIKILLTDFHLNSIDRQVFKNSPIQLKEILDTIEIELRNKNIFPGKATLWKKGEPVFEGFFIEKINENKFKLHAQRHYATDPFTLAESNEQEFLNFEKLVEEYIKREYKFIIDGLKIEKNIKE